ncbi:MAG: 50S ribosomal protein L18 [Bacteroidetes bacterium ADurb.Bin408]|nr:MAG: 50S ribosomal protein L18 [Bacteroidetes bacterium ADurb.Bin408]
MKVDKTYRRNRIKNRIRKVVKGTSQCPRLSVFRSNSEIYAQIIDDVNHKTLVSFSSLDKDIVSQKVKKIEKSKMVGETIAKKAIEAGVTSVVFDRSGYLYHGRVKVLAEAAREAGLKF